MLPQDFNFSERLVSARVEEEQRRARARRLQAQAAAVRPTWVSRVRYRMLRRAGLFLAALGQRLQQRAMPPALPLHGEPGPGSVEVTAPTTLDLCS